jgi:hypothetical protein
MILHKDELKKMLEVLEDFPDVKTFEVEVNHSSGIGSITTMSFDTSVNEWKSKVSIEISGVANW